MYMYLRISKFRNIYKHSTKLHFTFETYSYKLFQLKIQLKFILSLLALNQTVTIAIPD